MGGGGQPEPPQAPPAPPSPGETSAQAIQAQIDALPRILASQQEFGPQFSQLNLEQLRRFGPQFADEALSIRDRISPELREASRSLTDFLGGDDETEFNRLRPGLLEDVRAGQSLRGLGDISPLGAIDEAVQIQRLRSTLKDRRLNVALSTAGRQPIGSIGPTTGTGQLVQNVAPGDIFGAQGSINAFNASIFGTQGNIFGTQSTAATARRQQNFSLISDIIGAGASGYGTFAGLKALGS